MSLINTLGIPEPGGEKQIEGDTNKDRLDARPECQ